MSNKSQSSAQIIDMHLWRKKFKRRELIEKINRLTRQQIYAEELLKKINSGTWVNPFTGLLVKPQKDA